MPTDTEIAEQGFQRYFHTPLKPFSEMAHLFDSEEAHLKYFKKVLYFTKAVIEPMEKQGMGTEDSIVDLASGDGQISLALALLGYRNITLYDMDTRRLNFGKRIIQEFRKDFEVHMINASATDLSGEYDVLICYQTIEHLSDEGNYSIAKRSCQVEFLERVDRVITKMCYFNAPNQSYLMDGHDTGKPFFHFLPMAVKKYLIGKKYVRCSWPGICRPVTVSFLARRLPHFKRVSKYYAFSTMKDYVANYPLFDYMGSRVPQPAADGQLSLRKKVINGVSTVLGGQMQKFLPVLSVIYVRR